MADGGGAVALDVGLGHYETTRKASVFQSIRHGVAGFGIVKNVSLEEQRQKRLTRLKKTVVTSARLSVAEATMGGFRGSWAMVTLTYRPDVKWDASQMSALTAHVRKYAKRKGFVFRYVWVMELHKSGRPHYHLLVWLPAGRSMPKPDKQGWWPHGSTNIKWARKPVGYIAKYASKGIDFEQSQLIPKGARLCGNGGLSKDARTELRYWKLPTWVRDVFKTVVDVGRVRGVCEEVQGEDGIKRLSKQAGGYTNRETGQFLESPWKVIFLMGSIFLMKKDGVA